jgi:hypothetical protein
MAAKSDNMKTTIIILVIVLLAAAGCASGNGMTSPLFAPAPAAAFAAPQMGIVADENLRVVEVLSGQAAEAAGLQVGDILLDLTWIPSDAPAYVPEGSDTILVDAFGSPVPLPLMPLSVPAIPPPVESYIEKDTVPFTDIGRIISLVAVGVPLRLRLLRDNQVLELVVTPGGWRERPHAPGEILPTVTPLPLTYYYY